MRGNLSDSTGIFELLRGVYSWERELYEDQESIEGNSHQPSNDCLHLVANRALIPFTYSPLTLVAQEMLPAPDQEVHPD